MLDWLEQRADHWLLASAIFVVGAGILMVGGNLLVDGAVALGRRLRISTLVIGLTVVAFGTSAPELVFNIVAVLSDRPALCFGNVVGSNIANIALVLGVSAVVAPLVVNQSVVRREAPIVVGASMLMVLFCLDYEGLLHGELIAGAVGRIEGFVFIVCFSLVIWLWYRMAQADRSDPIARESQEQASGTTIAAGRAVVILCASLLLLPLGAKTCEIGAAGLARWFGISEAVIGLTIVALATSLPELGTSVIAARKGHTELAIGNILGSNMFNIFLVFGVTSMIHPVGVPMPHGLFDLAVMIAITIALSIFTIIWRDRLPRGPGMVLVLAYGAMMTWSVLREVALPP